MQTHTKSTVGQPAAVAPRLRPRPARKVQFSIRLPSDLLERLDEAAAAIERTRSWTLARAIRRILADDAALEPGAYGIAHRRVSRLARVSVRVDARLAEQLDALGERLDRTRTWLVERGLVAFLCDD